MPFFLTVIFFSLKVDFGFLNAPPLGFSEPRVNDRPVLTTGGRKQLGYYTVTTAELPDRLYFSCYVIVFGLSM